MDDEKGEENACKRRRLQSSDLVVREEDQDAVSDNSIPQGVDSTPDEGSGAPWTLSRLMRTFQSSHEIQEYVEQNRDEDLIRFLETLQQVGRFSTRPSRKKLVSVNDLADVSKLLRESQNILILTGAGVSVSAGIPDFRSTDGIYARLKREFDMPSPTCMFDINYFNSNPGTFFNFASELWPGRFKPSRSHLFMADLERRGKLLRNYTQNIDTLEHQAGPANECVPSLVLVYLIRVTSCVSDFVCNC
jgi:hypothetical protein